VQVEEQKIDIENTSILEAASWGNARATTPVGTACVCD